MQKKIKTLNLIYQPAMLCIFLRELLICVISNHSVKQLRVFKLEVKSCIAKSLYLGELFTWRSVTVAETCKMDTVDPFALKMIAYS